MRAFPALLPLLVLCACAPRADVPATTAEIPAAYRAISGAAVWPTAEWWRGFGSPELDQLIAAAGVGSFDIQAAAARVRQADAQLRSAGSGLLPNLSLGGAGQWSRAQRVTGAVSETRSYQAAPSASWEPDIWGKLRAGRDSAAAAALASRFDQQAVALTVVTSVASTWFQALALQDRVDIARRNLADAEEVLRAVQARQAAGTVSQLDVAQQSALVANVRAQIPALRSQLEQSVNALGLLVGRPPSAIAVRPDTLTRLRLPEISPGLPSALLARRPDVAAAEARLVAARADIKAARAAFFPTISLTGAGGWQSLALSTLFGPGSFFANAALSATQPIFENGALTAQLDLQRARHEELLATYRQTVVQAFTDVENAATAYRYATEQEALAQQAVAVARQAANIAREQVRAGTSDLVQALQAQTTLFNDLDLLAQVRLARFQSLLALYKAVGGGWSRGDVAAPSVRLFQGVL
jgi:NodT family efflux transporter outer membrane factor (OMF) lipoprotein